MRLLYARRSIRIWRNIQHSYSTSISSIRRIDRVLIANRGEIALRIMRTARRLGVETVAIFSDADRYSMHTKRADRAYHIGPSPSLQSYLSMEKIIETALRSGSQAIHPGYGFLSENAEFAEKCASAGIIFIGPPPKAIRDMGAKNISKQLMADAGVPVVMGYHGREQTDDRLRHEAANIGYPVMLKAVYGGGGKGMRIAWNANEFNEKLTSARSEAIKAFGNDEMIVEKFVERPRHVEVQIFGDHYGNYVYLWERDCSVQRRHQKIIEEAPAPGLNRNARLRLGESAVRAARAVGYVGAGTVEFIMDRRGEFFFMEMNTRLQVEHPVSEAITGTDLVEWQFKVAEGERLPLKQDEIKLSGHALEARIYAEDTKAGFIPIAGHLKHVSFPNFARVDTGVEEGDEVSIHYDPMIAKVIVWGEDREKAIAKMSRALQQTHIGGLSTNVSFVRNVLAHEEFIKGNVYTEFIADHESDLFDNKESSILDICESVVARMLLQQNPPSPCNPFLLNDYFRLNHTAKENVEVGGKTYFVEIEGNDIRVDVNGKRMTVLVDEVERKQTCIWFTMTIDGQRWRRKAITVGDKIMVFGEEHREYALPRASWVEEFAEVDVMTDACAPMPGVVEKILVKAGDQVKHGQALVVIVAMKMEYIVRAPYDGIVHSVQCAVGMNVPKNAHLVKFDRF
uniref:Methylcrotonoyl-CoA carboxylase subunit alpha, mitochondrial n=1 Tax=Parascaris univalens TaxID=6257 RepID=A0A915C9T6_PARUN